jgi:pseudaminic acid cytidylyltransferase
MANLCIIPARGGSKRIPKKNTKLFLDKPIIAYSIEAALQSQLFNEVMVSTDDADIAAVAITYGAKVPFIRSEKNSNDFATTYDVLEEVINEYKKINQQFNYGCCIYACAPLIQQKNIVQAFEKITQNNFDCVFPIVQYSTPIQRAWRVSIDDKLQMFNPDFINTRSQDLEKAYFDAGQFYWFNIQAFQNNKSLASTNTSSIIIDEIDAQDIDNETDWKLAEIKYQLLQKS